MAHLTFQRAGRVLVAVYRTLSLLSRTILFSVVFFRAQGHSLVRSTNAKKSFGSSKWEEGDDISVLEFKTTEYGRSKKVVASEEVKQAIRKIGINKCARESGFDRKNFIRKLIRGIPVKRNSYNEFVRWLQNYSCSH